MWYNKTMNRIFKTKTIRYATIVALAALGSFFFYFSVKADPVFFESNVPNPTCFDNFGNWPHSNNYTAAGQWNPSFVPMESYGFVSGNGTIDNSAKRREQFIDLNGDGLLDYLYVDHEYMRNQQGQQEIRFTRDCVYMNNGHGWDQTYRCKADVKIPVQGGEIDQNYWGDCAAQ